MNEALIVMLSIGIHCDALIIIGRVVPPIGIVYDVYIAFKLHGAEDTNTLKAGTIEYNPSVSFVFVKDSEYRACRV